MSFKDKVAAGATLIKDALQSAGFISGSSGWQIRRDGGAEFSNLIARGDVTVTTNTLPAVNVSLTQVASDIRRNRTTTTYNDGLAYTSTAAAIPGATVLSSADLVRDILSVSSGLNPTDQIYASIHIDVDAASTSASGSGGHLQARYVHPDGSYESTILEYRQGVSDGQFMASQTWNDTWVVSDFNSFFQGNGPSIRVRHTGSTAYTIKSITVTIALRILR